MIDDARSDPPPADGELQSTLATLLTASIPGATVRAVRRRQAAYRSSFHLEELDVELADGRTVAMMFKDVGRLAGSARHVKPAFLHHPEREILLYRDLLAGQLGTPACYGAVVNAAQRRYWLFLERVAGLQLRECGDFARWLEAAAWLARFHARFASRAAELKRHSCLLAWDRDFFAMWMPRAVATVRDPGKRESLRQMSHGYAAVVDRLASLPLTLIHGEFYPSNILVRQAEQGVSPVDWEMAGVGPGAIDLAALVTGWAEPKAVELTRQYYDVGGAALGWTSVDELSGAVDYCRLHLAIQWLGWSGDWTVPVEHEHDWHQAALGLAERIVPGRA